jgi:pilus assembly protein Flp/PilA
VDPRDQKKEENMRLLNEALLRVMTWARRDEGQTLVEYALIIALISIAAIAVMVLLGGKISSTFTNITGHLV